MPTPSMASSLNQPRLPNRQSIRLSSFDYTRAGAYFITICTEARRTDFGHIADNQMHPTEAGAIVKACWNDLPHHHSRVELDAFQLMPNHVHAVIKPALGYDLSTLLQGIKGVSANRCNKLLGHKSTFWMGESYDHIVRDVKHAGR